MSIIWIFVIILGGFLLLWFGWGIISPFIWEKPEYEVIKKFGRVEIRRYEPARVLVTESNSFSTAFSTLSGFIFGNNVEKKKVAMTTPVLTEQTEDNKLRMVFFVPKKFADQRKKLPTPYGKDIVIQSQDQKYIAAVRFRGRFNKQKRKKYEKILIERLKLDNIETVGQPLIMQYSDPFVPSPLRINEIGIIAQITK
ncbi:MAG: heme-binding protein [Candidatus Lokiarchaeota archaeon]|nr:heme-binding protein [Candidatus Lokiarchaeota archaeon]